MYLVNVHTCRQNIRTHKAKESKRKKEAAWEENGYGWPQRPSYSDTLDRTHPFLQTTPWSETPSLYDVPVSGDGMLKR